MVAEFTHSFNKQQLSTSSELDIVKAPGMEQQTKQVIKI
jgi:hypothetical protein